MSEIAVLGLGNFGTALARNWTLHGKAVRGWTVEEEVFASITRSGSNEKYLPGIDLHGLAATMNLREAVTGRGRHRPGAAFPRGAAGHGRFWRRCLWTARFWWIWPRA